MNIYKYEIAPMFDNKNKVRMKVWQTFTQVNVNIYKYEVVYTR